MIISKPIALTVVLLVAPISLSAQITSASAPASAQTIEAISTNVSRMASAVEALNKNWYTFFKTFSSDKGAEYFTERQKFLLFTLEVLNRYEKSLAMSQEKRLMLIERQSKLRMQLATITDDLRPEAVDRFTAWRGTTDAQAIREIRRTALQKEQREISAALAEIASDLLETSAEIRRMDQQITTLRNRIFGEIDRETVLP